MPDIGNTLREARIKRGLSISDVEKVTKIRSKYLEALEENDFDVLPGSTVVKGFLRSYAVFLKLDPDLLLYEYGGAHEQKEEAVPTRPEPFQPRRTQAGDRRKKRGRHQRGYVAAALLAVAVIVVIAWLGARPGSGGAVIGPENLPSSTTVSTVVSGGLAVTTTSTDKEADTTTTSSGASTVVTTTGQNVTMVLSVTEGSCWLVVRQYGEDGAELYAGTLSAGGTQTFNAAKRYWLRAGIPEVLSISINGTPFTVTGEAGTFLVTETGVERQESGSTETTE